MLFKELGLLITSAWKRPGGCDVGNKDQELHPQAGRISLGWSRGSGADLWLCFPHAHCTNTQMDLVHKCLFCTCTRVLIEALNREESQNTLWHRKQHKWDYIPNCIISLKPNLENKPQWGEKKPPNHQDDKPEPFLSFTLPSTPCTHSQVYDLLLCALSCHPLVLRV